jgi:mannose-6-phosphate isomerase-like protein (cupin superfamily)
MAEPGATTASALVRMAGEGSAIWLLGGFYEVKLSADETGDALTLVEMNLPAGMGPPPHVHAQDEVVYILEGTATYHLGDQTTEVGPGSVVFIPKGTQEFFVPTTALRALAFYLPGGADRFFAEAGEPAQTRQLPPAPTAPPDFQRLAGIAARYGLELVGPPPR